MGSFAPYGTLGKVLPLDENHPLYHEEPLYTFKDHNVLVEGVEQAKLLTKTVEVKAGLPAEIENRIGKTPSHPDQHTFVERYVCCLIKVHTKVNDLLRSNDQMMYRSNDHKVLNHSKASLQLYLSNRLR